MTQDIREIRRKWYQEAAQKARERLGDTSRKVLRWLLRFVYTDLAKLSEGQWLDLQEEFREFTNHGTSLNPKKVPPWHSSYPEMESRVDERGDWVMWRSLAEESQKNLRVWLERLMETYDLEFDPMPIKFRVRSLRYYYPSDVMKETKYPEATGLKSIFLNGHHVFAYHVAQILASHCDRLCRCTECQTIFLVDRRQQVFCSPRCLNRVTQRRWRESQKKKAQKKKIKSKSRNADLKGGATHGKSKR
jgi:hypothetical protein